MALINYNNKKCQFISYNTVWRLELYFQKNVHLLYLTEEFY